MSSGEPLAAPVFPAVARRAGHYESYYIRAVAPDRPAAAWIRYTVHKRPNQPPKGSVWCTVWDGERPYAVKQSLPDPGTSVPWIAIGESSLGPREAHGRAEAGERSARWELAYEDGAGAVQHLPMHWLYRSPIPRTKTATLVSDARFRGEIEFDSRRADLGGWRGMAGHNWGTEHAERWIWLHGIAFADAPDVWLDCVLGRLRIGGRLTPWIANGLLCLGDQRVRLGGVARSRATSVRERATGAGLSLPSAEGNVEVAVSSPDHQTVAWVYADPAGGEHHALHCSVAAMEIRVGSRVLATDHGCAYELGVRETDHGVPLEPFEDG
jgi:hypothetical protein